ncbi:MAG TPA: sigma-54-dependent Fis family transcriptional regulator [Bacteroidetes bacterium]|nr:sigma-54-dependent Fis family transcriptional regulator [Bacteroidota bacterium]
MEVKERDLYRALLAISEEINTIREPQELLRRILDIAMQTLNASRGFIILKEEQDGPGYSVAVARNLSHQDLEDLSGFSSSVVQNVLREGQSILSYDAQEDERFKGADSIVIHRIQSVAAVPLRLKNEIIGAIYLDHTGRMGHFDQAGLEFLTAFANQAAIAIENARLFEMLRNENETLRSQVEEKYRFEGIIGRSAAMERVFHLMEKVINTDATVLIEGESGTGKELVARALHYSGPRKRGPFIAVFCGALSESLLESELFGHRKGAFTGAREDKKGLLEAADQGTVFLDEISEVGLAVQTKLLRFLQEGEIKRVGDTQIRRVNVRVIAATNKNLEEEVRAGRFREDLFYRLNVIRLRLPPLRERQGDIPLLAQHFLEKYARRMGKPLKGFRPEAMRLLESHSWPGNVRELENTVERAVILAGDEWIGPDDLQLPETVEAQKAADSAPKTLREAEREFVLKTLKRLDGNISRAAKELGVSRRWLHYRLKEWGHET